MKKVQYILGMIFCCVIMFLSCTKNNNDVSSALLPELVQAEEIMYESPDSALHILQTMSIPQPSDKLQYATWALFMTQAKYKLYMNQSDSLINVAYDFFIHRKDSQRKAMVLYYKASLLKEKTQMEDAQNLYLKAIEDVEKTTDYQLAHLIYSGIGSLYLYNSLSGYAVESYIKAYDNAQKSKNKKLEGASLIYLGRAYENIGQTDRAIDLYKQASVFLSDINEYKMQASVLNDLACILNRNQEYKLALFYAKESMELRKSKSLRISEQLYLTLGEIYQNLSIQDSAYYYFNKALNSDNIHTLKNTHISLYNLCKNSNNYKVAISYLEKAWICNDSIYEMDKKKALIEMQEKYNQQKVINEKNELEIKKNKVISQILIGLFILLCCIALIVFIYQKKLLLKERLIQDAEEKIRVKTIQIQENEFTISRNQKRMEELMELIDREKDVHEQMEEQQKVLHSMREYNERLEKENIILQKDVNSISFRLKEKSREIKKLKDLSDENLCLQNRTKFLVNQIIQKNELLNKLKVCPKYIELHQWEAIKELINYLFDNYTERLSNLVPTLTESDIQICCLIKLHIPNPTIAILLAISSTSVSKRKMRLKERILSQIGSFKDSQTLDIWLWDF